MKYYDIYKEYCRQKIADYQAQYNNLQAEFEKDNNTQKETELENIGYLIQTAENVLNELEDNSDWYINDGHGNGNRFLEYLNDRKESVDNSIGYEMYYICYDLGRPEEYSPNPKLNAEQDFYCTAVTEIPALLIDSEPKGYVEHGLKCLRENIAFFNDLDSDMLSEIKKHRKEEIDLLSQEDKDFLAEVEKRMYLFQELDNSLGLDNSLIDKMRYYGDKEYAGEDFSDNLEYWTEMYEEAWDVPENAYTCGMALMEGKFSKSLIRLAYDYLYSAAEEGHVEANYQCGLCWLYGRGGCFAHLPFALKRLEIAAEQSHKDAIVLLEKYSGEDGEKLWNKEVMHDANGKFLWYKDKKFFYEQEDAARSIKNLDTIYEFAARLAVEEYDAFHFEFGFADIAVSYYEFILDNLNEKKAALALAELYEKGGINLPKDFDKANKYRKMAEKL